MNYGDKGYVLHATINHTAVVYLSALKLLKIRSLENS